MVAVEAAGEFSDGVLDVLEEGGVIAGGDGGSIRLLEKTGKFGDEAGEEVGVFDGDVAGGLGASPTASLVGVVAAGVLYPDASAA